MRDEYLSTDAPVVSEVDKLMREATRITCATSDYMVALPRFLELFPKLAPQISAAAASHDDARRALGSVLFREVWNRVPRPDNGFRPRPLPKQERNDPCQCGSGHKYKQCCAPLEARSPFGTEGLSLLRYVLDDLPQSAYENLPFRHLSPEELAFVADQWLQEGRADSVTFLLVPLLADVGKLDARHEAAFDLLGDAYMQLGMPEQRAELVERVMAASDPTLRSAALHRRCTMLSDAGEWPAAWKIFAQAQRLQPDNPALSHLEVIMLANEGRFVEASERARFWLARLARMGMVEADDPLLNFLRMMSDNPEAALAVINSGIDGDPYDEADWDDPDTEWFSLLVGMLQALPAPESHYKLSPLDGNAGELQAARKLAKLEAQWREEFQGGDPFDPDAADPWQETGWLDWLAENPLAWQSFAILDDVAALLDDMPCPEGIENLFDELEEDLLAHAAALLSKVIKANKAQNCRLEWGWLENRPALRLLQSHIDMLDDPSEKLQQLQWLVCTLNPNDNQGCREPLARLYIELDRPAEALELCDAYPGDGLGAMRYARVLSLYRLGRTDEAAKSLTQVRQDFPKILKTLLAARPRMPEVNLEMVQVGGEDEAWYYRMDWLPLWQQSGALDWAKKLVRAKHA